MEILVDVVIGVILGWFVVPRFIIWVKMKRGIKAEFDKIGPDYKGKYMDF